MAMGHWFLRALKRRKDVELWTVGPYTGDFIPWNYGMRVSRNYLEEPNMPLDPSTIQMSPSPNILKNQIPWKPDLFLIIDAGWCFSARPEAEIVAHIQTDPHVLKPRYALPKSYSDFAFCMQKPYMEEGEIYLPYGYDPKIYFPEKKEKEFDGCLIGLHYPQRDSLVSNLRSAGYKIHYSIGEIFDENRILYNKSRLALSWSTLLDLPARVWEGMGMGLPVVTNRVPDLDNFFTEGLDYIGFENLREGIAKTRWALENYDACLEIGKSVHVKVRENHTWDKRVEQILKDVKLI